MTKHEQQYNLLLKSGMFWSCYPELTGDYQKDKEEWLKIQKNIKSDNKRRSNSKV